MIKKTRLGNALFTALLFLLFALGRQAFALTVEVSNVAQLQNAISSANQRGGDTVILLIDGVYVVSSDLMITAPNISLRGKSQDRTKVTIQGDAMSATANVGSLINVYASDCRLQHLTLQKCRFHLIQIHGELNADRTVIKDCILRDSYEQMIKVTVDLNETRVSGDNGLVENCLFEYSAGIGPQYYIGGIDAHAAKNWIVRNNVFKSFISPSVMVSEFAIHFWNNSANNLVEKNLIIDCDRGIGFGLQGRGNSGGIIRNNMIYHSRDNGAYADVGIALAESPDTQIYNNTVFQEHDFPWAIEYRFPGTQNLLIANNLTNQPILARDGAFAALENNVIKARSSWFVEAQAGNLHLAGNSNVSVVDQGVEIEGLVDDFDGDIRSSENRPDIGADETSRLSPPKNLRIRTSKTSPQFQ
jgi:hypothetical protein